MKHYFLLFAIILTAGLMGNSIFSFEGVPIQYYGYDVYGSGMGDTGSADLYRINQNLSNPSMTVTSNMVVFSTAVNLGFQWYKDKDNSYRDDGLLFPYFAIILPLSNHKLGFNFSNVGSGNLQNEKELSWEDYSYSELNRISTSIYKTDLSYAYKNDIINIGVAANYYLGHRTKYWKQDFDDLDLLDTKYEIEKNFKGLGFTAGISKKIKKFSFGIAYSSATDLKGDTIFKYIHSPYSDTLDTEIVNYQIPEKFTCGFTWKLSASYKISMDTHYERWTSTDIYDKDVYKVGLGFAYDPLSGYGNWYNRIPYRFGFSIRELPFEVNNNTIMENSYSAGISIPLKTSKKKLDLMINYIKRGELDKNKLEDNSLMFSIGVSGFDIFSKRLRRTSHRDIPKAD